MKCGRSLSPDTDLQQSNLKQIESYKFASRGLSGEEINHLKCKCAELMFMFSSAPRDNRPNSKAFSKSNRSDVRDSIIHSSQRYGIAERSSVSNLAAFGVNKV